jgi:uncharacterized protein (TIGR00730 family)
MTFSVCVFCGSRAGSDAAFPAAARELGELLGQRGWRLIYGGGDVGLMGIVADAALRSGAQVLGVIPQHLLDREVGKRDVTELVVTQTMFARKEIMIERSDALLILPGGFGTLDELLEVLTLRQLGYHDKPIVLIDIAGYWRSTIALFEHVVASGFADGTATDLYKVAPTVTEALDLAADLTDP